MMTIDTDTTTVFTFPGGWKGDIEQRLSSLKEFAESDAAKKFVAEFEQDFETIVTISERRKA